MKELFVEFAVFTLLILVFMFTHEFTHVSVAKDFDCQASMDLLPDKNGFMSVHSKCQNLSEQEWIAFKQAQSQVESTGYQLFPVYILLTVLVVFSKKKGDRKRF